MRTDSVEQEHPPATCGRCGAVVTHTSYYRHTCSVHPACVNVGDRYEHATGVYEVDWVCGCGDYDDGETCVGLSGGNLTWTGTVSQLREAGFVRYNAAGQTSAAERKP